MIEKTIIHISVFPEAGKTHSAEGDISALAGYLKALLAGFSSNMEFKHIVLTNLKSKQPVNFEEDGVLVIECWKRGSLTFFWSILKKIFQNPQWRIVHLQHEFNQFGNALTLPLTLLLLVYIRLIGRRKLVVTLHEVLDPKLLTSDFLRSVMIKYPASITQLIVRIYYFMIGILAHTLIAQDKAFVQILKSQYFVLAPVEIVRIGTTSVTPPPKNMSRHRWKLSENERVVLFFGTLDWRKGLDCLVDAWQLLPPDFGKLIISGGTPTRVGHTPEYRSWRKNLENHAKQNPSILFLGFVADEDLPSLFGAADLAVLPYIVPQRVSAVFNQAASFGIPLIASSVFSDQAASVMLFDPTPTSLSKKIRGALTGQTQDLRRASKDFRENNSWQKSASHLSDIYLKLN